MPTSRTLNTYCLVKETANAPVKCPRHSNSKHGALPKVLDDKTGVIVPDPSLRDSLRKRHTKACIEDEYSVGNGEREAVASDHRRELEVEGRAISLNAADIGADGEEEEGYPKERKEAAELVGIAGLVGDVEMGLAGGEGDHGA